MSAEDTAGAMCVFEVTAGWPRHLHHEKDEWLYIVDGQAAFEVGAKRFRADAGESVFIPRKVPHVWSPAGPSAPRIVNIHQPAGKMEELFRELASATYPPTREQMMDDFYSEEQVTKLRQLFETYGMDLLGPPLTAEELATALGSRRAASP